MPRVDLDASHTGGPGTGVADDYPKPDIHRARLNDSLKQNNFASPIPVVSFCFYLFQLRF